MCIHPTPADYHCCCTHFSSVFVKVVNCISKFQIWSFRALLHRELLSEQRTSGKIKPKSIHPKRWFPRFQESADNFEFSAERLSENAKSIKITLFAELLTAISPIYVQSLLNLSIKTLKHTIFSTKMPHWHQILVIFMIYALLSRNFAVRIYALFPQIFGDWKVESAYFFTFRMYAGVLCLKRV